MTAWWILTELARQTTSGLSPAKQPTWSSLSELVTSRSDMVWLQNKKRLRDLEEKLDEVKQKKIHLSSELARVQVGREESEQRSKVLTALDEKQAQKEKLAKELEQYKSCDPQTLKELRECWDLGWVKAYMLALNSR